MNTRGRRWRAAGLAVLGLAVAASCSELTSGPETPFSIEMPPFAFPAVVLGDTLRDSLGVVAPVRAIVRNSTGDSLASTDTRYLYAEANRDSALLVDSLTGIVVARRATTGEARIAARVGGALQVLRRLIVTVRPDTVATTPLASTLTTVFPDTGRTKATANTTEPLVATVRNRQGAAPVAVEGWLVRYTLVRPANPTNDTTLAAFLVNEAGTPSTLDTTDTGGSVGRRVRVRAAQFPTGTSDSVVVRVDVRYRGLPVAGSGATIRGLVQRGTP